MGSHLIQLSSHMMATSSLRISLHCNGTLIICSRCICQLHTSDFTFGRLHQSIIPGVNSAFISHDGNLIITDFLALQWQPHHLFQMHLSISHLRFHIWKTSPIHHPWCELKPTFCTAMAPSSSVPNQFVSFTPQISHLEHFTKLSSLV